MGFDTRWKLQTLWALVLVLLVSPVRAADEPKPEPTDAEYFQMMQIFVDTFEQVERNYVKEIDRRKLLEAALRGMLKELDPYSNYIPPEELARFTQEVDGEFGGIGIQVQPDPRTNRILVISPLPDTPAYRAGVRAGDIITEVNGFDTENMPLTRAVQLMKGPPGETIKIKVLHMGASEDEELAIERAVIQVRSVLGDHYNKDGDWEFMIDAERGIGYIRLTQFGRHSSQELAETVQKLLDKGMKGLILDLRFNPGGLLSQAVSISDLFIDSGVIVSTAGKNTEAREFKATRPGTFPNFPMVVLVNRFSASASEIVSACLQDHKRAVVVGERSWGKGSVQNIIELESGSSALKLTTAGYKRPSGRNIHRFPDSKIEDEWGVSPDEGMDVQFSRQEMEEYDKWRRERDILSADGPPASEYKDRQMEKAREALLKALDAAGKEPATEEKKADDKAETEAKAA